jgi:hypothetical protein
MKDFFSNTIVRIVAAIFVVLGSAVLILGGVGVDAIAAIPKAVLGIVSAFSALILIVNGLKKNKE